MEKINKSNENKRIISWLLAIVLVVTTVIPISLFSLSVMAEAPTSDDIAAQAVLPEVSGYAIEVYSGEYDENSHELIKVTDAAVTAGYTVEYLTGSSVDTFDDNGNWSENIPAGTDAGQYYIKARLKNNAGSNDVTTSDAITVEIQKVQQNLTFKNGFINDGENNVEIKQTPYTTGFAVEVTSNTITDGAVTYTLEDGNDIAEINPTTGELTVNKAGVVKVKAELTAGDSNNFEDAQTTNTFTVKKVAENAGDFIRFADDSDLEYNFGENAGTISTREAVKTDEDIVGEISYKIDANAQQSGIDCNPSTGEIKIADYSKLSSAIKNNPLEVTVTASKEDTEFYGTDSASYKVKVTASDAPVSPVTYEGKIGENNWYISDVKIKPAEGYQIATDVAGTFCDELNYTQDGTIAATDAYLRNNTTGAITKAIHLNSISIDKQAPAELEMELSDSVPNTVLNKITFGFFNKNKKLKVTVKAKDETSGVKEFKVSYTKEEGSSSVNAESYEVTSTAIPDVDGRCKAEIELPDEAKNSKKELRGTVTASAVDYAGNSTNSDEGKKVIVDTINPEVTIAYKGKLARMLNSNAKDVTTNAAEFLYGSDVTATITAKEANLFDTNDINICVTKDGASVLNATDSTVSTEACEISEWTPAGEDTYTKTVTFKADGKYSISVDYKDWSGNEASYAAAVVSGNAVGTSADGVYTSKTINVDTTAPVYKVTYDNNDYNKDVKSAEAGRKYYKAGRTATIEVTDKNFRTDEASITAVGVDVSGKTVKEITSSALNWTQSGDTYTAKVEFKDDANYTVDFACEDMASNNAALYEELFTVDTATPSAVKVSYSQNVLEKVLNKITFGFYNKNKPLTVTLESEDTTSGVDYFDVSVVTEGSVSATNENVSDNFKLGISGDSVVAIAGNTDFIDLSKATVVKDNGKVTLSFNVPAAFRGSFSATAVDKSANSSTGTDAASDKKTVIADEIAPDVEISYNGELKNIVDKDKKTVSKADKDTRFIYNPGVTATITVKEANFFEDDMVVTVTNAGAETVVTTSEAVNAEGLKLSAWSKKSGSDDEYVRTIEFSKDGDYTVGVEYKDKSENDMSYESKEYDGKTGSYSYVSNVITVDTTNPVYTISYDNNNKVQTVGNRDYYDVTRTATIVVEDKNFRPDEVTFSAVATNAEDENVTNDTTAQTLKDWKNWSVSGKSVWIATVPFDKDANYTVDFAYVDMAGNKAVNSADGKEEKYSSEFTVDTTAPADVNISYSDAISSVKDTVLDGITFGFYGKNKALTVTVSATDNASGVEYFDIGAFAKGSAAATTIELPEDLKISKDGKVVSGKAGFIKDIKASKEGKTVKISFEVPAQFRGIFTANATDYSHNEFDADKSKDGIQDYSDNKGVIVDEIAPEVNISYSGDLKDKVEKDTDSITRQTVAEAGTDTRYVYSGEVTANITVKEANFFDDMTLKITKDGLDVTADTSVCDVTDFAETATSDTYEKIIKLKADGDYVIEAVYTDRSENDMSFKSDEYAKKTGTKTYTSNIITVDTTKPVYSISYDNNAHNTDVKHPEEGREYYGADRTATITVTDRNFRPNEVSFAVKATDVNGNNVSEYTYSKLTSWTDWTQSSTDKDTWTATVPFDKDANYTVDFDYTDIAGNKVENAYNSKFTVDKTAPTDVNITYSDSINGFEGTTVEDTVLGALRVGFYNAIKDKPLVVTVSAKDATSGIDYVDIDVTTNGEVAATDVVLPKDLQLAVVDGKVSKVTGSEGFINLDDVKAAYADGMVEFTFEVPAQFRGAFTATATDKSANKTDYSDDMVVVADTVSPAVNIEYKAAENVTVTKVEKDTETSITRQTVTDGAVSEDTRFVYSGSLYASITVDEANFYSDMKVTITRDGRKLAEVTENAIEITGAAVGTTENSICTISGWTEAHTRNIYLDGDGDYVITVEYADRSENDMSYASNEYDAKMGTKIYTSNIITIDTVKPVYTVTYDNNTAHKETNTVESGRQYFNNNRTATITVTDRNFRPNEVNFAVKSTDISGSEVKEYTYSKLTSWTDWTQSSTDENTWTATVPYNKDANYTVDFDYTDIAGNKAENAYNAKFTVDKTKPSDVEITYSQSIIEKVISSITFGFYKPDVTVTVKSTDNTSGVDYFEWQYTKQVNTSSKNAESTAVNKVSPASYTSDRKTAAYTFTIPASARGYITSSVYDRSGNSNRKEDSQRINVVDNISPNVEVTYDAPGVTPQFVDSNLFTVDDFNQAAQAFYNNNVTAKIKVDEANFLEGESAADGVIHQIGILLTKTDDNGNVSYIEYLPNGASPKYNSSSYAGIEYRNIQWNNNGDEHTFDISYDVDSDYILTFEYTDLSQNDASIKANDGIQTNRSYTSKIVTVDKSAPVVNVSYSNNNVKNIIDGRAYYDDTQSATITVYEHNFRADDIKAVVSAVNVVGDNVFVDDYAAYLSNRNNWVKEGNTYTAHITYSTDANYTFDIEYTDLARNVSGYYPTDVFTVDKTNPEALNVTYSTSVLERVLEAITFGFYNAEMTVTISADDYTSGIWHYVYSYINSEGVSSVNAQLLDEAISNADITYNGARATTQFKVPKYVLGNDNQFNGTVTFDAYDRSELSTQMKDTERLVVDNIAPTATITYNDPVQNTNNISYYDKDVNASIQITEANFYSEDVVVTVTKNGASYPVNVSWTDNSVDVHTGTFVLSEDGDYTVAVSYTDRSTNKMNDYQSNQITVDTKEPVITVENVKNESANNEDTISIGISVVDKNIALDEFKPSLRVVKRVLTDSGKYEYQSSDVALGSAITSQNSDGETVYEYKVDNLDDDGYYSMSCVATDYANHKVSNILSEDGSGQYSPVGEVDFSVNRDGSVFWIETEHNDKYTDKEYTDELNGKYANDKVKVTIHEVNVDKVDESDEQRTKFTLNDGSSSESVELEEGDNGSGNYRKNQLIGEGGWYENTYTLDNTNFDHDGKYSVDIVTYDKANNSNLNSKDETGTISFILDTTDPVITSNAKSGQRAKKVEYPVEFVVSDANLDESTLKVSLNGEEIEPEAAGDNRYKFTVANGLNQNFEITANDLAGNKAEIYKVDRFTVSTNVLLLWYANTALFWGSIGGATAVILGVAALLFLRRRKKIKALESDE